MNEIVKVKCIKHIYPDKTEVNICGLDFIVEMGERVAILGPNGSGKTTLLSHILGLLKPLEGEIKVFGMEPSKQFKQLRKKVGIVFQNVDEQIIGPTVFDDIAFPLRNDGVPKEEVKRRVEEMASRVGISEMLGKIPHYLSGGQKKKVALAGAMITGPSLLIMDEPFDGLDPRSKREMIELLNDLNREMGTALIVTTHDINLVPDIADLIYILNRGKIVLKGSPCEIFMQADILKEANLEAPVLVELFTRLNRKGYTLPVSIDLDTAEGELLKLLEGKGSR